MNVTLYLSPEIREGLKRLAGAMSPGEPLSMSAVVRSLVEDALADLDEQERVRPCNQVSHVAGKEVE